MPLIIDIISDVVCPWCYIGKRHLEQALATLRAEQPTLAVSVRWHPYFLNPDTPPAGEPYRAFLENKFGGAEAVAAIWSRVRAAGEQAGLAFAFEKITLRPHTLAAHRLIQHAQQREDGSAEAWVEALFAGHFQQGLDIGDIDTLAAIGQRLGEDPAAVRAYLEAEDDSETILGLAKHAQEQGINGVPFFIFNHQVAVSGAQPPEILRQAMAEVLRINLAAPTVGA